MSNFLDEVHNGLSGKVKKLNPKWLYDFNGSKLFEEITKLQEYYEFLIVLQVGSWTFGAQMSPQTAKEPKKGSNR